MNTSVLKFIFSVFLILTSKNAFCEVKIIFNYDGVEEILAALEKQTYSETDADRLLKVPGVQAMIANAKFYVSGADELAFKTALEELLRTGKATVDPLSIGYIKKKKDDLRTLIETLRTREASLLKSVTETVQKYSEIPDSTVITVYFIAGGVSDGFYTVAGKGDSFRQEQLGHALFIAIDVAQGDPEGIALNMTHELFHVAQGIVRLKDRCLSEMKQKSAPPAVRLLANTVDEGTANFVADPLKMKVQGPYFDYWKKRFEKNTNPASILPNFALFDLLLYAIRNNVLDWDKAYSIGFSSIYDAPLYFVGYEMAKTLEKYEGSERIKKAFAHPPELFFREYIVLYRKYPKEIAAVFSRATEEYLEKFSSCKTE